jgi:murein DD-endopeptidase MepM/ murein hydrolase activator NlpD
MKLVPRCIATAVLVGLSTIASPAATEPEGPGAATVTISPEKVRPGDPVLVTVLGSEERPKGKVGKKPLTFFAVRGGHQAVFAVPIDRKPGELRIDFGRKLPAQVVSVTEHSFPEADVTVPDEYANPSADARKQIDQDNRAIRKSFGEPTSPPQFAGDFKQPVAGGKPTSPFGEQRTFNATTKSQHLGLDVTARTGARVKAINDGTVVLVRACFLPGQVVVIDHGAGIASAYFHLQQASVVEGAMVKRGDLIGKAGKTGRATGPHMHLSVWVPGGFVDPATFLRLPFRPPVLGDDKSVERKAQRTMKAR